MRGFPILVAIAVFVSIGVRILKAISEAQENQKGSDWEGDDKGEWSEWKEATRASRPSPPPPPPATRQHPKPPPAPVAAQVRKTTTRHKFQDVLRDVQKAVKEAQRPPPPATVAVAAKPGPKAIATNDHVHATMDQTFDFPSDQPVKAMPSSAQTDNLAFESLDTDFPELADPDSSPAVSAPGLQVEILGRQDLKRAIVLREILERPRAFDL